jgi:hypothetical protein
MPLAWVLATIGRDEEAETFVQVGEESAAIDDIATQRAAI